MTYQTLDIRTDERGVVYVTLNLPEKRNALSAQMIDDLTKMARSIGGSEDTRAIVLSGSGDVFCAGGDLNWMKAQVNATRSVRIEEAS